MLIVNILFRDQPAVETLDLVNVRLTIKKKELGRKSTGSNFQWKSDCIL